MCFLPLLSEVSMKDVHARDSMERNSLFIHPLIKTNVDDGWPKKNHGWPKNCFKSHGLFKTYQMEKEMMVYLELHEVLAFQIHIWCKEHYSKKLYQGFLQLVLEYEWKMVVQQRNVSCFFECHQKSYMDELLNMYFVWLNVRQLVLHEIKVSKIHFCIVLIFMLDTCLWVVW